MDLSCWDFSDCQCDALCLVWLNPADVMMGCTVSPPQETLRTLSVVKVDSWTFGQLDIARIWSTLPSCFLHFSSAWPAWTFFLVKMPSCSSSSWALVAGIVYLLFASLLAVTLARFGLFNCISSISSFHRGYTIDVLTFQLRIRHWVQHVHVEGELGKISQRGGGGDALVHCCSVFLWYLGAIYRYPNIAMTIQR